MAGCQGASAIGITALGTTGLAGGLFVKGKDVENAAGTELYIQTREDTKGWKAETRKVRPLDVDILRLSVVSIKQ